MGTFFTISISTATKADEYGPQIDHVPIEPTIELGQGATLSAYVEDEDGVSEVYLMTRESDKPSTRFSTQGYFCAPGQVCRQTANMLMSGDGEVTYVFPSAALKYPGLDYYWLAIDANQQQEQDGSEEDFYQLSVAESSPSNLSRLVEIDDTNQGLTANKNLWIAIGGAVVLAVLLGGGNNGSQTTTPLVIK